MTAPQRPEDLPPQTGPRPNSAADAPPPAPASSSPPVSKESAKELTPEEQMALYEQDLKENDSGHRPC